MNIIDLPIVHEDGSLVSAKVSRIVELIREYSDKLDVRWIPPAARTDGEAAFCIVEDTPLGWRTVMTVQNDEDMNESVLERIYLADGSKHDIEAQFEASRKVRKSLRNKEWRDRMEQANDEARFLIKTPYHTVRFKGKKLEL